MAIMAVASPELDVPPYPAGSFRAGILQPESSVKVKFPSIAAVTRALMACKPWKGDIEADDEGNAWIDVRLQVYEDGSWAIRTGDCSYDQDHRGFWGASVIDYRTNCRDLAIDLLDQCREHAAQCS